MKEPENNGQHLLLIRSTKWDLDMSASQVQEVMGRFMDWVSMLENEGHLAGAQPLDASGKLVSGANGRNVIDGPFAESKEAIGGYFLLNVDSMETAVKLAQACPALEHGASIEVRPVLEQCPMMRELERQKAEAAS